LTFICYYSP